jgi:hypothetical protein
LNAPASAPANSREPADRGDRALKLPPPLVI